VERRTAKPSTSGQAAYRSEGHPESRRAGIEGRKNEISMGLPEFSYLFRFLGSSFFSCHALCSCCDLKIASTSRVLPEVNRANTLSCSAQAILGVC